MISRAYLQHIANPAVQRKFFSANVPLSPFVTAWYTEDISRVWKGGREFCQLNQPQNQGEDAQGKIEQQQALSFWNCPQHEWEPQMMSKEKGTSIKQGTQMFKNVSTQLETVLTHLVNVCKFNHSNKLLVSEC